MGMLIVDSALTVHYSIDHNFWKMYM